MQGEVKTIVKNVYWCWDTNGWVYKWIFATRDEKFFVHANMSNPSDSFVRISVWNDHGWVQVYSLDAFQLKSKLNGHETNEPDPSRFEPDVGEVITVAFSIIGLR